MIDSDQLRERIRERVTEGDSDYGRGSCPNCEATLTVTDIFTGVCTQCRKLLNGAVTVDDVDDKGADEHLYED